jgi:hypothetical protein
MAALGYQRPLRHPVPRAGRYRAAVHVWDRNELCHILLVVLGWPAQPLVVIPKVQPHAWNPMILITCMWNPSSLSHTAELDCRVRSHPGRGTSDRDAGLPLPACKPSIAP